jgi:DNA-directed RNA polymerase subunit beta'
VAELFEARKPKDHAHIIAELDGWIEFGKDYKNKRRVVLKPKDDKLAIRN